ncbi:MAG: glycerol-3-phosphate dehydrogenase [Bacteroidetes bacterium SW_9_63_38]|nr:MAG: glycerol-3-phosphate dehydrogenase [Bacteroidetes bacterium SW_9_63_38]
MSSNVTIFGAGSWGTALSVHLASSGRNVTLWARRQEQTNRIRETRRNPKYLSDVDIPESVRVTSDIEEAAKSASMWAVAVPSQKLRDVVEKMRPHQQYANTVVSLAKGIDSATLMTMTEVLDGMFGAVPQTHTGVLHGPSHSEEVAQGLPTTVVAAAPKRKVAENIQNTFMADNLRVLPSTDVTGVEIGGAATNVLAIAAGISDGIGYGDNSKASIITRGFSEIRELGKAMGASSQTFNGLAGLGDLVATCMSGHSRNRYVGEQLGRGKDLDQIREDMSMIAEGVPTTHAIRGLADRYDLDMPITERVYTILFEGERSSENPDPMLE